MSTDPTASPSGWGATPPSSDWGSSVAQPSPGYTDWGGPSPAPPAPPAPGRGGRFGERPAVFLIVLLVVALMGGSLYYLHLRSSKKPAPTTVALSLSFAKGDIHTYRTTISYRGTIGVAHDKIPFDMTIRGDMQWRVDKVSSQGIASVSVTLLHGEMTQSGVISPMGKDGMQLRIAPDGRILSSCTFGGPGPSWIGSLGIPGSTELAPVLPPDGSTSTGVSWSSQFGQTFPGGKNAIAFETTNTYLRSQQVHGVKAAVVTTRATIPLRLTIDLRRLFAEYKWPTKVLGHYRPQMHYKGSIDTSICWPFLSPCSSRTAFHRPRRYLPP